MKKLFALLFVIVMLCAVSGCDDCERECPKHETRPQGTYPVNYEKRVETTCKDGSCQRVIVKEKK